MEIKTYDASQYGLGVLLELHDHHTYWQIDNPRLSSMEPVYMLTDMYLEILQKSFKNLKVYAVGRSARHICIDDTPVNRRRYQKIQDAALLLEQDFIRAINNWEE